METNFNQYLKNPEVYVPFRYRAKTTQSRENSLNILENELGEGVVKVLEKQL
ncbi:MAG: hypothetical protein GF317_16015 [Candidatus Lokiarchaeota archaeon]|nr:hypothetical protein [Candidatus Lokiarchaeota archaeon]